MLLLKKSGTAVITVKASDGSNVSVACTITVEKSSLAKLVGQPAKSTNQTVCDDYGNKVVLPAGFTVVPSGGTDNASKVTYSYNGGDPNVQDGIVVQDGAGNQFVWIPVGTIKNKAEDSRGATTIIKLGRYEFSRKFNITPDLKQEANTTNSSLANYYTKAVTIEEHYQELYSSSTNTPAKNLKDFIAKTKAAGGYYIARYEASEGTSGKPISQANKTVWIEITQPDAATKARGMYSSSYFVSDLVNSYSWDTAIVFIQKYSKNSNYALKASVNDKKVNTGKAGDVVCNIHDMASNVSEWTTEHSTAMYDSANTYHCVYRGGKFGIDLRAIDHGNVSASNTNHFTGFRPICYVN